MNLVRLESKLFIAIFQLPKINTALINYINRFNRMLSALIELDRKFSLWIMDIDTGLISKTLYPFAALFHPGLIWIAYLSILYFSNLDLALTALYVLATLISVILTTILKKIFKRPRPLLNVNLLKSHSFRKRQSNNSMPSGDAFQSAVFITFLAYLGVNPIILALIHIGVCTGRVYYMCHWVSDTMVSTVIGIAVGKFLLSPSVQLFFYNLPGELL